MIGPVGPPGKDVSSLLVMQLLINRKKKSSLNFKTTENIDINAFKNF